MSGDMVPQNRKTSQRTRQEVCEEMRGRGGGTSTLNAKKTKGTHS